LKAEDYRLFTLAIHEERWGTTGENRWKSKKKPWEVVFCPRSENLRRPEETEEMRSKVYTFTP